MSAPDEVRKYFDALADAYAHERDEQRSFRAQRDAVLAMLDGARGRAADIGCGAGHMADSLAALGFEVWAIDASAQMLERAARRLGPRGERAHVLLAQAERVKLPSGFLDVVVSMGMLEYLEAYDAALAEMHRLLRPGGLALLTVPNAASPFHLARNALVLARGAARRLLRRRPGARSPGVRRCVPWRLDRQLERAGLRPLERRWIGAQYVVKARKRY